MSEPSIEQIEHRLIVRFLAEQLQEARERLRVTYADLLPYGGHVLCPRADRKGVSILTYSPDTEAQCTCGWSDVLQRYNKKNQGAGT